MKSKKTKVIELIFFDQGRWQDGALKKSDVTFDDVQQAIQIYNDQQTDVRKKLSVGNPANFFKDLFRKHSSIIGNWPPSVMQHGFFGEQAKGDRLCFRFIPYVPATHSIPQPPPYPAASLSIHHAQTLSISRLNKALARNDENWLMAMATLINIPQIHFTLHSVPDWNPASLGHVQSNLKLRRAEIDSVFLLEDLVGKIGIVCIEAKGINDDINESQILDQVKEAQKLPGFRKLREIKEKNDENVFIIPAALKLYKIKKFPIVHPDLMALDPDQLIIYFISYHPVAINSDITALPPLSGQTAFMLTPPLNLA
jgi:hypothetical protein